MISRLSSPLLCLLSHRCKTAMSTSTERVVIVYHGLEQLDFLLFVFYLCLRFGLVCKHLGRLYSPFEFRTSFIRSNLQSTHKFKNILRSVLEADKKLTVLQYKCCKSLLLDKKKTYNKNHFNT